MSTSYQIGDRVQLATVPPGRGKRLRVGLAGEVVSVEDGLGWCSVLFPSAGAQPYQLRPQHLRRKDLTDSAVPPGGVSLRGVGPHGYAGPSGGRGRTAR